MQMQKRVIRKDDGRYLVYYHFPETASPEESSVFEAVQGASEEQPDAQAPDVHSEEQPHV